MSSFHWQTDAQRRALHPTVSIEPMAVSTGVGWAFTSQDTGHPSGQHCHSAFCRTLAFPLSNQTNKENLQRRFSKIGLLKREKTPPTSKMVHKDVFINGMVASGFSTSSTENTRDHIFLFLLEMPFSALCIDDRLFSSLYWEQVIIHTDS